MWCKILGVLRWRQVVNWFYELQKRFFSKSSVSLSPAVQQLLPQQASVGAGNQRAEKYMAGNIIASRTLKPTSMRNSKVQWVSACFSFNESSLWIEAKVFRKFPIILTGAASCFSDGISSRSRNIKTAVTHCHQLGQCEFWSDKICSLPVPEIWTSVGIWPPLWWDEKKPQIEPKQ